MGGSQGIDPHDDTHRLSRGLLVDGAVLLPAVERAARRRLVRLAVHRLQGRVRRRRMFSLYPPRADLIDLRAASTRADARDFATHNDLVGDLGRHAAGRRAARSRRALGGAVDAADGNYVRQGRGQPRGRLQRRAQPHASSPTCNQELRGFGKDVLGQPSVVYAVPVTIDGTPQTAHQRRLPSATATGTAPPARSTRPTAPSPTRRGTGAGRLARRHRRRRHLARQGVRRRLPGLPAAGAAPTRARGRRRPTPRSTLQLHRAAVDAARSISRAATRSATRPRRRSTTPTSATASPPTCRRRRATPGQAQTATVTGLKAETHYYVGVRAHQRLRRSRRRRRSPSASTTEAEVRHAARLLHRHRRLRHADGARRSTLLRALRDRRAPDQRRSASSRSPPTTRSRRRWPRAIATDERLRAGARARCSSRPSPLRARWLLSRTSRAMKCTARCSRSPSLLAARLRSWSNRTSASICPSAPMRPTSEATEDRFRAHWQELARRIRGRLRRRRRRLRLQLIERRVRLLRRLCCRRASLPVVGARRRRHGHGHAARQLLARSQHARAAARGVDSRKELPTRHAVSARTTCSTPSPRRRWRPASLRDQPFTELRNEAGFSVGQRIGPRAHHRRLLATRRRSDYWAHFVALGTAVDLFQQNTTLARRWPTATTASRSAWARPLYNPVGGLQTCTAIATLDPGAHARRSLFDTIWRIELRRSARPVGTPSDNGYQANLYRTVNLGGSPARELVPFQRIRQAARRRCYWHDPDRRAASCPYLAFAPSYRFYWDDWGMLVAHARAAHVRADRPRRAARHRPLLHAEPRRASGATTTARPAYPRRRRGHALQRPASPTLVAQRPVLHHRSQARAHSTPMFLELRLLAQPARPARLEAGCPATTGSPTASSSSPTATTSTSGFAHTAFGDAEVAGLTLHLSA